MRAHLCKLSEKNDKLVDSKIFYENPKNIRYGNLVMKNVVLIVVILVAIGVYWKKRQQKKPMKVSGNVNVMTLWQTVCYIIFVSLDNTVLSFVISSDFLSYFELDENLAFNLEMLRVILVENIFFKFLVPLYLLQNSKTSLPSLWVERDWRRLEFSMTSQSLIPRPVVSKYEPAGVGNTAATTHRQLVYVLKSSREVHIDIPDVEV